MLKKVKYTLLALTGLAVVVQILIIGKNAVSSPTKAQNTAELARTSVKITSLNGRSGGSGIILASRANSTTILTNKHVCQLIQVGGNVVTETSTNVIYAYKVYPRHDLCLVNILADLHQNTKIAEEAPMLYEDAAVSGHPSLLPTLITRGHFSNNMIIQIMVDIQACTGDEKDEEALMCMFMGGKPVLKTHDSQLVSATIMPGSSGSGVFNSRGELSGVVFAGTQGLSYGFIVPYGYMKDFLLTSKKYKWEYPNESAKPKNFFTSVFKAFNLCGDNPIGRSTSFCRFVKLPSIWSQDEQM